VSIETEQNREVLREKLLERDLREVDVVVFDLETTGLNPDFGDEIVEFGAVRMRGFEVLGEFESLADPGRGISPAAAAVNGITGDMLRGAPELDKVFPGFLDFIGDSPLVAQNAKFDVGFVGRKAAAAGLRVPDNVVFDTLRLARRLQPGHASYSLVNLVARLGIDSLPEHRALGDVYATMKVFETLMSPYARDGISVGAALELQGGTVPWPKFKREELEFRPQNATELNLLQAIKDDEALTIEYESGDGAATTRDVRPLTISRRNGHGYLVAHCFLRNEERIFRVDRLNILDTE